MKKKRVVVLGAGISGLTAAHALRKNHEVILLEKSSLCGGVMNAVEKEGFFFESGPRTFRTSSSPHLLALCEELGLTEQIIGSCPAAKKRYVLFQKKIQEFPSSPLKFFSSPLCRGLFKHLLREWRQPRRTQDETIYAFAARRFGEDVANRFFDPLSLGVFGCDARRVSICSALPQLKEWECLYGSVTGGLLRTLFRKRKAVAQTIKAPLFSFRQGTPMLVQALEKQLEGSIRLQEEAISLQKGENLVVKTSRGEYPADMVVSALPPHVLGRFIQDLAPAAAAHLLSIPMTSMTVVHFGYRGSVLPCQGFGYLVPTSEQERVMGVVFDSEIFPCHNTEEQTRLTIMLQGGCADQAVTMAVSIARDALQRHLGIVRAPDVVHVGERENALPVMEVGHTDKIAAIQQTLSLALPQLRLVGNYLGNPSVEHCISRALNAEGNIH